ncbi:serine/threonine-protein phosphatase 2A regulatory subunit B'' subunit beta isoform X1 [Triplophysa dalaica]|uniref:serine/threonine-protein phosphatase 2A regulatory subunit B'' subunit beta isoform X1 n=1 Tax=Triplophysa dalaica TaxID=1582913 RepID=UPI0024DF52E0|nr:serine/threonine-protein phosphatase 2A regulatory subunit B'' subunit beta isoform X1 [Triplophysa dalaica]XP_056611800.1 serine/threonine-protein phosphatase 2A regulatory subunit B'' subunit beta isoform X1 [Triplophysa dalaica]XP_056611802.1 serine/threonine-protein phosphatase 2A regulatory subunit B'' subunit beta isoform X1 [Triplophysa dalaica]
MASPQTLQPVLKMKVDELFLFWLSEPSTQAMLKDYLNKIKNGDEIDLCQEDFKSRNTLVLTENNNNHASKINATERMCASLGAPCSPPSATLPSASGSNNRAGLNARALRRSVSTKKQAQAKREEPVTPALSESIPKFYFPRGQPPANINIDNLISKIEKIFSQFPDERVTIKDMGLVAKACECPLYWKAPLFHAAGGDRRGHVSVHKFVAMWRKVLLTCHDDASKFLHLLAKPGCNYLEQEDFIPFLQDVVDSHTGLAFLKEASDFHSRYITTVVQRIFYNVNRSWTGKITCSELRRSSFLQNVALLEEDEEINQLTEFFSYEHFYVIYCKFWELDTDHDLYIDQRDLARHNDQAISNRMIERIFSGAVTRDRKVHKEGKLSYADFVWFLISEEDKKTDTSIVYWFRCMDLDGDGVLSMYELQYFYHEQCQKLETMGIEPLPFEDCLCQMLDLVKPEIPGKITLRDLKRCKLSNIFFDTLFNIEKYLDHEQRDPLMAARDAETMGQEISDWERYAAEEYDHLVAEETTDEQYNDGYENLLDPVDHISCAFDLRNEKRPLFEIPSPHCNLDLDEYEYEDDFE